MQIIPGSGSHWRHHITRPPFCCPPSILILSHSCQAVLPTTQNLTTPLSMKSMKYSPFHTAFKVLLITSASASTTLCLRPHPPTAPGSCMRILWTYHALSHLDVPAHAGPSTWIAFSPTLLQLLIIPVAGRDFLLRVELPWLHLSPMLPNTHAYLYH